MALKGSKFNASLRIAGNVFSEESIYQQSVLNVQTDATLDPGASPTEGDRYILTNTAALNANFGSITGVGDGDIVEYDGSAFLIVWDASAQGDGAITFNEAAGVFFNYSGSTWGQQSATVSTDATIDGDGSVGSPLSLSDTAVTPGSYGDAQTVGTFTVDQQGRLTVAGTATIDDNTKIPLTQKGAANGVATLDANSKIPSAQLPAIAITDVFTVADITARDALTVGTGDGEVQEGDVAIVTDASTDPAIVSGSASYIYNGSAWSLLKSGDDVLSVNGATGSVTVNAINELTGDITAGPASGSQSAAATISALAVDTGKLADDAVTAAKLGVDAVDADALNYASTGLRGGAISGDFSAALTRTVTHNWGTSDVQVEVFDSVTGETCFVESIVRTANTVAITLNQFSANSLRILLKEIKEDPNATPISIA